MDNNKSVFAKNLKYQMAINNKTRREVCEALEFSYYTFSDWVNGKKYPRMDKVEILANYFGCKKSDLIEEKKEKLTKLELEDVKVREKLKHATSKAKKLEKQLQKDKEKVGYRGRKSLKFCRY